MRYCLQWVAAVGLICVTQAAIAQQQIEVGIGEIRPTTPPQIEAVANGERVDLYGDPLPHGAHSRLGTLRYRHLGWYKQIAGFPGDATFVIGGPRYTVQVWDATTGRMTKEIALGDWSLKRFCLSRDGRLLAVLAYVQDDQAREHVMQLKVWDTASWNERAVFQWVEPVAEASECVALAPNRMLAATGTRSGTIRFWDLLSGLERSGHSVLRGGIESIDFSPNGESVAVAGRGGVVLWQWASADDPITLSGLDRGGQIAQFSPDGRLLAVGESHSTTAAHLFDVPTGNLNRRLRGQEQNYYREGLAFTGDGKQLLVPARSSAIEFFDMATGKLTQTFAPGSGEARGVAVANSDQFVAAVASESEIRVWDLQTGESLSDRFVGHSDTLQEILFLADGQQIATAAGDGTIRVWDGDTGMQKQHLRHEGRVAALAASLDGTRLLSNSMDDTVRYWDAESQQEIYTLAGHGKIGLFRALAVAFTDDQQGLLSFGNDLYLRHFDAATGKALAEHAIRPEGIQLVEADDGTVRVAGDDPFGDGGLGMALRGAEFSADGKRLWIATQGDTLLSFDVATGQALDSLAPPGGFRDYAISRDGSRLATVSEAKLALPQNPAARRSTLRMWRVPDLEPVWEQEQPGGYSFTTKFSPDGALVGVCLYGESPRSGMQYWISIYSTATGEELYRIEDYPHKADQFAFSPDNRRLAAGHADTSVLLWGLQAFRVRPDQPIAP